MKQKHFFENQLMTLKGIGTKAKSSKGSSKMWLFRDGLTDQKYRYFCTVAYCIPWGDTAFILISETST